jgi:hypothetical protein
VKKTSFGLLELEMVDLEHFLRKTPLGPLGVKKLELVIPWDLLEHNIQTSKFFFGSSFYSEILDYKIHKN